MSEKRFEDRLALITGASRGIGFWVARALAAQGAHVICCGRTQGGLEDLDDRIKKDGAGSATLVPFDITDGDAIDNLAAQIYERWKKLDILIANAGVLGQMSPLSHIKPDDFEKTIAVNLTANFRLIRAFDPLLRQSSAGRAVFVSTGAVGEHRAYWGGYSTAKAALENLAFTYANETLQSNVKVNVIDPGRTRTAMRAAAKPGEDPNTLKHPSEITEPFLTLADAAYQETGERVLAQPDL
ncbi:MAG: SDR family NAD(P)-dependent oxidoreductase [Alphaproteobacteria bacterium]